MLEFVEGPTKSSIIEAAANEDLTALTLDAEGRDDGNSATQRSIEIYIGAHE